MIHQNNVIRVKTCSKEEQRSRSTLQWDQRRIDRTNNTLWLHAFQVKQEQHSRYTLEVKQEQIATRMWQNEPAEWHQTRHEQEMSQVDTLDFNYIPYIPYIRGGRLTNWAKIESGRNYITTAHAFVKATFRLGSRAPLVARKKNIWLLLLKQLFEFILILCWTYWKPDFKRLLFLSSHAQ